MKNHTSVPGSRVRGDLPDLMNSPDIIENIQVRKCLLFNIIICLILINMLYPFVFLCRFKTIPLPIMLSLIQSIWSSQFTYETPLATDNNVCVYSKSRKRKNQHIYDYYQSYYNMNPHCNEYFAAQLTKSNNFLPILNIYNTILITFIT